MDYKKKNQQFKKQQPITQKTPNAIYMKDNQYCMIVNAKPNSKTTQISGISEDAVDINIAAPPRDGEANEELINYLIDVLGVKKWQISISKGSKGRDKLIMIQGAFTNLEEFYEKIISVLG